MTSIELFDIPTYLYIYFYQQHFKIRIWNLEATEVSPQAATENLLLGLKLFTMLIQVWF